MDGPLYLRMTGQHFLDNISIRSQTKTFHHFRFSMERPGIVYCREFVSSLEEEFTLLKNRAVIPLASVLPQKIQPEGLSEEHRNYLFRLHSLCMLQGGQRIFFSAARFFISPPKVHTNFHNPPSNQPKNEYPPPPSQEISK